MGIEDSPSLSVSVSLCVCVCGLITFCFRCLSVHAQTAPCRLLHESSEGKYAFLCLLAWVAVLIFYRSTESPFYPALFTPPIMEDWQTGRDNCRQSRTKLLDSLERGREQKELQFLRRKSQESVLETV